MEPNIIPAIQRVIEIASVKRFWSLWDGKIASGAYGPPTGSITPAGSLNDFLRFFESVDK